MPTPLENLLSAGALETALRLIDSGLDAAQIVAKIWRDFPGYDPHVIADLVAAAEQARSAVGVFARLSPDSPLPAAAVPELPDVPAGTFQFEVGVNFFDSGFGRQDRKFIRLQIDAGETTTGIIVGLIGRARALEAAGAPPTDPEFQRLIREIESLPNVPTILPGEEIDQYLDRVLGQLPPPEPTPADLLRLIEDEINRLRDFYGQPNWEPDPDFDISDITRGTWPIR